MRDAAATAERDAIWPVALDNVRFDVGDKRLIDGVSLTLTPGPVTVIMGPNGAGKSLLLRLIAGLIAPSRGRIHYGGAPAPGRNRVAVVFQRPIVLRRSVRANLAHALKTYGVPGAERRGRIAELLRLGQLEALADQPARLLSGGEQQRLAMVRALAAQPDLILLDEPTASLDPQATAAIEELVGEATRAGMKAILVTHDGGQAGRLAEEIVFLHRGRVTERTPAARFFGHPQSPEAEAYLGGRLLV